MTVFPENCCKTLLLEMEDECKENLQYSISILLSCMEDDSVSRKRRGKTEMTSEFFGILYSFYNMHRGSAKFSNIFSLNIIQKKVIQYVGKFRKYILKNSYRLKF